MLLNASVYIETASKATFISTPMTRATKIEGLTILILSSVQVDTFIVEVYIKRLCEIKITKITFLYQKFFPSF